MPEIDDVAALLQFLDQRRSGQSGLRLTDELPGERQAGEAEEPQTDAELQDRKSTRLNSSHSQISYAVFCLKKKKNTRSTHSAEPVHRSQQLHAGRCGSRAP